MNTAMNAALVPIKRLTTGKSRLEGALDRSQLEALCLAMMEDVLSALLEVDALDRVIVATPDAAAAAAATALGAEAFLGEDPGLNTAIERGGERLAREGAGLVITVLGDVAGAEASDFAQLIDTTRALASQHEGIAVGLAPSADGGTAALARCPANAIEARFGADSAALHRAECAKHGIPLGELDLPSLRLDLDREADIEAFLALERGGPRTRATLEAMSWRSRVADRNTGPAAKGTST